MRQKKGLGLAQAKAYVEAIGAGTNPDETARAVPAGNTSGLPLLAFIIVAAGAAFFWWSARYASL